MRYPQRKPTKIGVFSLVIPVVLELFVLWPGELEAVTSSIAVSGAAGAPGIWGGFWLGTGWFVGGVFHHIGVVNVEGVGDAGCSRRACGFKRVLVWTHLFEHRFCVHGGRGSRRRPCRRGSCCWSRRRRGARHRNARGRVARCRGIRNARRP